MRLHPVSLGTLQVGQGDALQCTSHSLSIRPGEGDAMRKEKDSGSRGEFGNWFRKIAKPTNRQLTHNNVTFLRPFMFQDLY